MPTVDEIIRYEDDEMSDEEVIVFFQKLIDSGMAWKLQGFYGCTAARLIKRGYCFPAKEEGVSNA